MRSVVLPPSRHQCALASEPRPAECCCGQRRPRRPGCCRETHRSPHTHEALKTFSTARKEKEKREQNGSSVTLPHICLLRNYHGNYTQLGLVTTPLTFICGKYTQLEINHFQHLHNSSYSDRCDHILLLLIWIFFLLF